VTQASIGVGAEVGVGTKGVGGEIGGSGEYGTTTGANDNLRAGRNAEQDNSVTKSQALAKSFNSFLQSDKYRNIGTDEARNLQRSLGVQKQYADTLSESKSVSDVASDAVKRSSGFVSLSAKIGGAEVANQMRTNADYRRFQLNEGRVFGNSVVAQPYLERARRDMEAGVTDRIVGDDQAAEAMARHRAAFLMATDEKAAPEDRLKADEYLLGSSNAMLAARFSSLDMKPREHFDIASPANRSGVQEAALVRKAGTAGMGTGRPARSGLTETLDRSGYGFAEDVGHGIKDVAEAVQEGRRAASSAAVDAGLAGPQREDTRVRTRENIGANFKSTLPDFLKGDEKPSRFEVPDKK
jgi:conjugal transfer mating pair stabilization protein TraG